MWIKNFQTYKLGLEKAEEAKIIANIRWITEKARELQKNVSFCFIDYTKAFVWITTNCGKFFKRWEYQTTLPVSWETYMQIYQEAGKVDCYFHLFKNFPQFVVIHTKALA